MADRSSVPVGRSANDVERILERKARAGDVNAALELEKLRKARAMDPMPVKPPAAPVTSGSLADRPSASVGRNVNDVERILERKVKAGDVNAALALEELRRQRAGLPTTGTAMGTYSMVNGQGYRIRDLSSGADGGIVLDNGSLWEVAAMERTKTDGWKMSDKIRLAYGKTVGYPVYMLNERTGKYVSVKMLRP